MSYQEFLSTLGLDINSSVTDVKKAYRELAKQWHPDKFYDNLTEQEQASEKFRQITEAYQFLLDYFREPKIKGVHSKRQIKVEKTNPEFFYNLGVEFAKAEEYDEAINAFTQAICCDSTYLKGYQYRAFLLEKLGFNNRAKTDFDKINQLKKIKKNTSQSQQGSTNKETKTTIKNPKSSSNYTEENQKNVHSKKSDWSQDFLNFPDAISAIAINKFGDLVVVAQENKDVYLRSLTKNQRTLTYQLDQTVIRNIVFNPTQDIFYLAGDNGKIYYCSVNNTKISLFGQLKFQHTNKVRALAISQNRKLLLSGSADKTLKIWNIDRDIEPITLAGFSSEITYIIITPDDQSMIIANLDKNIHFRRLENGKLFKSIPVNSGVNSMAISQNGQFLSVGSFDHVISIWDVNSGEIISKLNGHQSSISGLYFMSDDRRLISTGNDGIIYDWDWRAQTSQMIGMHLGDISTSAFCFNSKLLVTGGKDKRLGFWAKT